ncbi:uncharacterized protein [Montipora capricornis]|uniref:uncharacterized protein n=1 Tax=Montipora capricornis TaxID=246305 RepID=UPI0035F1889D
MAAENVKGESILENLKKRRGSYLSYLSHPWLKVPRTSKLHQELSKEDCACDKERESGNSCQTGDDIFLEDCGSFDVLEGFLSQKEAEVDAQEQLTDESSVTGTVNEPFCSVIDGAGCSCCNVETSCTFSQVQDFSDDPALGVSQIAEDLDENRMNELLEPEESDSLDSFVKITELSSSCDAPLYAGSPVTFSVSLLLIITFAMRRKQKSGAIEDIFDGRLYKKHFGEDGFLRGTSAQEKQTQVHLSLQINTDGVAVFRSSKFSIWPVYFTVNELPPNCRQQRKYRLFAGLWFGVSKPHFQTFMQPFATALNDLFFRGIPVKMKDEDRLLRCILLLGTFDAPAKCLFQEFCQFNAFHGCPYCLSPGKTVQTSSKGHTHAYPFDDKNLKNGHGEPRTHEQTLKFAAEATKKCAENGIQNSVKGVKGYSWFMFVPKFDIIRGVAIDYMHSTLLGVVKMLLTLWSDKSYKGEPWSVCSRMQEIEERYLKIGPPSCITRLPRSLFANFGHLKASELRTFLLFYSIPCLYGILPEQYFQHYILLVEAIYLLLQDSISPSDIIKASSLLKHFCIRIKELYAARYETFNVHCLLHLTERVMDLGPLWTHSCFCFEDFNGELRSLFHRTQSIEEQIVLAISVQQKIPELVPLLENGSSSQEFYAHLSRKRHLAYKKEKLSDDSNFSIVGNLQNYLLAATERAVVESLVGPIEQVCRFQRLLVGEQLIHSKSYKSMTRRNNYTVEFKPGSGNSSPCYGHILFYIKIYLQCPNPSVCDDKCKCKKPLYYTLMNVLKPNKNLVIANDVYTGATVPHLVPVMRSDNCITAIPVEDIVQLCFYVDCGYDSTSFVGIFPNQYEKD